MRTFIVFEAVVAADPDDVRVRREQMLDSFDGEL
jgi:hypothetical protein